MVDYSTLVQTTNNGATRQIDNCCNRPRERAKERIYLSSTLERERMTKAESEVSKLSSECVNGEATYKGHLIKQLWHF